MNPQYPEQTNGYDPQAPSQPPSPPASYQSTDGFSQPQMPAPNPVAVPYVPPQLVNNEYQPDPYLAQSSYAPTPDQSSVYVTEPPKKAKKPVLLFVIIGAILLIGILATGAFLAWQSGMFGTAETPTAQTTETTPATTFDTPEAVETELSDVQKALDSIDESQLADDTLSDAALHQ